MLTGYRLTLRPHASIAHLAAALPPSYMRTTVPASRAASSRCTEPHPLALPCRHNVDFCFGGKQSVEEVYEACERSGGQWGFDMIGLMSK